MLTSFQQDPKAPQVDCQLNLQQSQVIKPRGPWKTLDAVEYSTAEWVDWFNHRRLYSYCGDIPPADAEAAHYAHHRAPAATTAASH